MNTRELTFMNNNKHNKAVKRITIIMEKEKQDKLKHILIDENKTLTDFIIECVDTKIKGSKY